MRLYHVTPASNLPSIKRFGLQPKAGGTFRDPDFGSNEAKIYLTKEIDSVLGHALKYTGDWAVLAIETGGVGLHKDEYEEGHYYLTKGVPPSNIRIVKILHNE